MKNNLPVMKSLWVDADMICLRPMALDNKFIFGYQDDSVINSAVLGGPAGHELFGFMANQAGDPNAYLPYDTRKQKWKKFRRKYFHGNERGNVEWGELGPRGLTRGINHHGLAHHALPIRAFYPIHSHHWYSAFDESFFDVECFFPDSYGVHLWNEMMRRKAGFDKNARFSENSLIEVLSRKYGMAD